ncbi:unnamed protein product [Ceutorhynchus assimilis]|uniref:ATP synthase F(0) complex subunit e, mitochondrial n=1 Tax=Ceutorhynchus assimilis TaxID=467358 RepID=A0A9N9MY25_9CUCU|nr:unnamed protein product [Ceutorhynchus assimilis]
MREYPPPVKVSPVIKFFRYTFLISGIFYGALKLQFLKTLKASRADDRARRIAARDARLMEERILAAERDFQQIVEIFAPPQRPQSPRPDVKVSDQPLLTSMQYDVYQKPIDLSIQGDLPKSGNPLDNPEPSPQDDLRKSGNPMENPEPSSDTSED